MQVADAGEAFANEPERFIEAPAPHRQDGADIQRQHEEPRSGLAKRRCRFVEQPFRQGGIACRQGDPGQCARGVPGSPGTPECAEPRDCLDEPIACRVEISCGQLNVPQNVLGQRPRRHVP